MRSSSVVLLILVTVSNAFNENNQPKIVTDDGNLKITSAKDRNISVELRGRSRFVINNVDILSAMGQNGSRDIRTDPVSVAVLRSRLTLLYNDVRGPRRGILRRLAVLENRTRMDRGGGGGALPRLRQLRLRVTALETKMDTLMTKLSEDNCRSNPCQNGGSCIDIYDGFLCHCPPQYQGPTCVLDVNECEVFAGTGSGCQNGATCMNSYGGYFCHCATGFQGVHCLQSTSNCLTAPPGELCDHGVCVQTSDPAGYKCICEQGWITNGVTPVCSTDVDECSSKIPHCSQDPPVQCINTPGSYTCGSCPAGYSGNGHSCVDIDECQINNGGCSINPHVPCINTRGSYACGSCPLGFVGDGRVCSQGSQGQTTGICANSANVCHPQATCQDVGGNIYCSCPYGFTGNGFGPAGCTHITMPDICSRNPCQNGGTCISNGTSFTCICPTGKSGPLCTGSSSPCDQRPCLNGGTCLLASNDSGFTCNCTQSYTGVLCQTERRACGGTMTGERGILKYPDDGSTTYNPNSRCAWLIRVNSSQVINVTFTKFNLENSVECRYDWLQIHDGRSSAYHMIGRFCGTHIRPGHVIISTHNYLYFWFRSDSSHSHAGFELTWEAVTPTCGGLIDTRTYGTITSPGSPGNYPPNRECQWLIRAPEGKRIQFHFFVMKIEHHETCSYDYLAIYSGPSVDAPLLSKYCSTTHPEPLTTPSNEVTLFFHSDEDSTDSGFQIHYSIVEGFPGCGGIFTAYSGEFGSPIEDESYPHNIVCEYAIKYPKGSKVRITFKSFELEGSEGCRYDYVEVFEIAMDDERQLVGRYCGSNIPPPYKSNGNELLVVLTTDWSSSYSGFRLGYQIDCGGVFEEETGVLTSPLYPEAYHDSRVCDYVIQAPLKKAIALDFQDFDMEENSYPDCYYDYLEIFDGTPQNNNSRVGRYCGHVFPPNLISSFNVMYLTMSSDSSLGGRGFKANYTFIDVECGGVVTTSGAVITSPPVENDLNSYAHSTTCRWLLSAPVGHIVQLTWVNFNIEAQEACEYDYVEMFDNSTHPAKSIGKFCGTHIPAILTSAGNVMTVAFVSDSSVNEGSFSFMVTFGDATKNCGGTYYTNFGYMRSPGWPGQYAGSKSCEWVIIVDSGSQIELNVKHFSLEEHQECDFDFLEVRNGGRPDSPLVGKYCGTKIPPVIRSFSNQIYVKFSSDASRTEDGFEIEWDGTLSGCGGRLTSPRGSIISPNYPASYADNAQCVWKITVSHGSQIQIIFSDLDLEKDDSCTYDYLEVFDGKDASSKSLGKFCNADEHPLSLQTTSNFAMLRMRTDFSNQGRGFNLRYDTICTREVVEFSGIIESPNFPNNYPNSLDCAWTITAPLGNKVYIEFLHFEIENNDSEQSGDHVCNFDYITIEEKDEDQIVKKKKYCNSSPKSFTSVGEVVIVSFKTDSSISQPGFRLEYHVEGCGGSLTNPTGVISSPNYPDIYPHHIHCNWAIKAPYGNSIELTISDFQLESSENCYYDGLAIYNGDNYTNPITKLCHVQTKPTTYTSNGAELSLKFYTDASLAGKGFNSSYKFIPIKCGGVLTHSGNLYSPNYPKNYEQNSYCEWFLYTDDSRTLEIEFVDFDIEESENCQHDSLSIYELSENVRHLVKTWCKTEPPPQRRLILSTSQAVVTFRTDDSVNAKGFHLNFTSQCGSRIFTNSSGVLTKDSGIFDRSADCVWTIISIDPSRKVALTVSQLELYRYQADNETESESRIEVYDGDSINATLIGTYTKAPPTLYSSGNAITLQMHPEMHDVIISHFSAHYSIFENTCGGTLKSFSGAFASPLYPNPYPANIECIWTLEASPGNEIFVEFSEFNIAPSPSCSEEYLEVRENNGGGRLLGVFCGMQFPSNITSAQILWIKFRSGIDVINEMRRFYATFSYLTMTEITNQNSGFISSPLYPQIIHQALVLYWRITVDYGSVINIAVKDVNLYGDCYLYVQIYDGFNEDAPPLGEKICGVVSAEPVTSTSNVVYIEANFYYPTSMGIKFNLEWKKVPKVPVEDPTEAAKICGLTNIIMPWNQTITNISSPGYPNGYDGNLNCTWIVSSENKAFHPVFVITYLDLEDVDNCLSDRLIISQSKDLTTWKQLAVLCNMDFRTQQSYSGSPYLKIEFLTDWGLNRTGFRGNLIEDCGGYLTDPVGQISAGLRLPFMQPIQRFTTVCIWEIHVRQGRTIHFEFDQFSFPKARDSSICEGYVLFKNGGSDDSPLLGDGKYCGDERIPEIPDTISNRAYIKFDVGGNHRSHFSLTYREVSQGCGGPIHLTEFANNTVITSPNYPNIPHPHTECIWIVFAPNGESLKLDFEDRFDLFRSPGCVKEYVELRNGGTKNSEVIGNFCDTIPPTLETQSNILRVKYFTDVSDPKNGFKLRVTLAKCGGTFRQSEGMLTSPQYPGKGAYPSNSVCTYRIIGSPMTYLNISFVDINLPPSNDNNTCDSDHVTVYAIIPGESDDVQKQLRGTFCGSNIPESFFIDSHEALIEFTTGQHQDLYRGFSLRYNIGKETCGAQINAESGIITSPGYPTGRQNRRFCEWTVTVPRGRRVRVDLLDLDLIPATHTFSQRLGFYHDHRYLSRIAFVKGDDPLQTIYSSSNKMLINMWVRVPSSHRGFKLRFSSDEATVCEGDINMAEGEVTSPKNLTTYYCDYIRDGGHFYPETPNVGTLAFRVRDSYIGRSVTCRLASTRLAFIWLSGPEGDGTYLQHLCGNISDVTVRTPFPDVKVEARQGLYYGPITFNMHHKVHRCGGMLSAASVINNPKITEPNYGPIDCAWHVRQGDGYAISLRIMKVNLTRSCDEEYINIYNGATQLSPHLMKICGGSVDNNLVMSENNYLFIEYHSNEYHESSQFEFTTVPAVSGCGGIIHKWTQVLKSPGNSSYYPPNIECIWEFRPDPGFHVGLEFVDRFYIEDSVNCTKDYVEIFDYRSGEWHSKGRVCGRETPPIFNATESSLKLVFRTDGSVSGDGFAVKWHQNCGGLYQVTDSTPKIIQSPNYPNNYARLLNCNYTFVAASDKYITLDFLDFELEDAAGRCIFDNLTIYKAPTWSIGGELTESEVYCRKVSPGRNRYKNKVVVHFRTDKWVERKGFQFTYSIDSCGGTITNSTLITSPGFDSMTYPEDSDCIWNITAPITKHILVKFEKFDIESVDTCYGDYVAVYHNEMKEENRLVKLCGNITEPPAIQTTDSTAVLQFKSDMYNSHGGFSAAILFLYSCDRHIDLTSSLSTYHLDITDSQQPGLQDCTYYISAPKDYNLRMEFSKFHVALCDPLEGGSNITVGNCSCDYLEVRDGPGPFSELVGRFCGHELPKDIFTSRSSLFVRYVTDSRLKSQGFQATITSVLNPCGERILNVSGVGTVKTVLSPGTAKYPPNTKCSWIIETDDYLQISIVFEKFDLQGPDSGGMCSSDYLEIADDAVRDSKDVTFGQDLVHNGISTMTWGFYSGTRQPLRHHHYCGQSTPADYISRSNRLHLTFRTDSGTEKSGFILKARTLSGCTRNYTETQGRIYAAESRDCDFHIMVPVNYTIAIYFNSFSFFNLDCEKNGIKFFEGVSNTALGSYCGYITPDPIFSTTNIVNIKVRGNLKESAYTAGGSYDLTFVATDQGRGCGGSIYNYGGIFSSPLYPQNDRNHSICTWDVNVPNNLRLAMRFQAFDMGTNMTCQNNYVKFYETDEFGVITAVRSYCGGDVPATFKSEKSSVSVVFAKDVNFAGSGWLLQFMGVNKNSELYNW
ncbi:Cubilin [Sergentomyia squamirostris]